MSQMLDIHKINKGHILFAVVVQKDNSKFWLTDLSQKWLFSMTQNVTGTRGRL